MMHRALMKNNHFAYLKYPTQLFNLNLSSPSLIMLKKFKWRKTEQAPFPHSPPATPHPQSLDGMLVHHRVTPSHYVRWYPFIHLGGERHCKSKVKESKQRAECPVRDIISKPVCIRSQGGAEIINTPS